MKLITKELENLFARFPLYSQDGKPVNEKKVLCKYFTPWGANTWIVTEASPNAEKPGDWDFFGVVTLGYGWEWGYFSLSELQGIRGQFGLGVERERYSIDPGKKTVYEVLKAEGNGGAEFAEEMLEWECKEGAEHDEQPDPEPEEVQPEAEQTQPEKPNLNHIIGQFFYAEQEYTFPRRSVHKDNIKITDVDEEKVRYKIVDEQLNEPKIPLGCGFMSIESFISGLAAGTIYAIKPAAPIIRLATSSAAPFAVLVDD